MSVRFANTIRTASGRELVILPWWEATSFEVPEGGRTLAWHEAESWVRRWLDDPELARRLRRIVQRRPPGRGVQGNDQRIVDELRLGCRLIELPARPRVAVKATTASAPPPAAVTEAPAPRTWFELEVVDEFGQPLDEMEVVFRQGSQQRKLLTDGAGVARWSDVDGPSLASAKIADVAALREKLKPRHARARERKLPPGPDVKKVLLGVDDLATSLRAEVRNVLVVAKPLSRVRLVGMHFDTNKCFLLAAAMPGIRKVVSVYRANPNGELLVVGHTDTTGDEAYDLDLSLERAQAVKAFLEDDVDAWEAWFAESKPKHERWGTREINEMIGALPCERSVSGFQRWSNETRGSDLKIDGIAGPKTRRALIEAYMALDGTTLPEGIGVTVHGCGEYFPIEGGDDPRGGDGVDAAENRRVELFCFEDEIQPPVPGPRATKGEPEYPLWQAQVTTEIDFEHATRGTRVVRLYLLDHEYQRMPHTAYELSAGGLVRRGESDQNGLLVEAGVPVGPCEIRWCPMELRAPPDPSLSIEQRYADPIVEFRYRTTLHLELEEAPSDAELEREAAIRLRNLGYAGADFAANYAKFRADYGLAAAPFDRAGFDELARIHREGIEAPPRRERHDSWEVHA